MLRAAGARRLTNKLYMDWAMPCVSWSHSWSSDVDRVRQLSRKLQLGAEPILKEKTKTRNE